MLSREREPRRTKRCFCAGSIILTLAIAAIGLGSGRQAAAQLDNSHNLQDPLKKKNTNKAKAEAARTKLLPNLTSNRRQGVTKTEVTPRTLPAGMTAIGKATSGKDPLNTATTHAVTGKGVVFRKGADGKTEVGKSAKGTTGNMGKGPESGTAMGKATDGTNAKSVPGKGSHAKGTPVKSVFTGPLRGTTPVERLRLRTDHRHELLTARRLLPVRPLPGERGFTAVPPAGESRFVSTEMVLRVDPNVSPRALDAAARRYGLTTIDSQDMGLAGGTLYHFRVASGRPVAEIIRALEAESIGVPSANYTYRLFQEDADLAARSKPGGSDQYIVNKFRLSDVHKVATGRGVLVAVIDSAIDVNHPDLASAVAERYDAVGRHEKPHFHGTGMVGAIAAHRKLLGVAPDARILAIQAFSGNIRQSPQATTRQVLAGLEWAVRKGARVINMSFAGPYDPLLQLAMKNAHAKGVVLIAAAGNLGPKSPPLYPAADPHVIAVTAVDKNDRLFPQAVRGPHLAVAAPGVDVMVPAPGENYQLSTGTSVAAAHVSGIAALLIERHPTVSATTILEVLTSTARKLSAKGRAKGRDDLFGWGLIDPASALAELDSRMSDNKIASASQPATSKQAPAPKQSARKQTAPRLAPASAQ